MAITVVVPVPALALTWPARHLKMSNFEEI
jgi:hypothetical protein